MDLFKWLKPKPKPEINISVKQGKNDRWRWQIYVGSTLYATCPVYGFGSKEDAVAHARELMRYACRGVKVMKVME